MNKKYICLPILVLMLSTQLVFAQKKTTETQTSVITPSSVVVPSADSYLKSYDMAIEYRDIQMAIASIYGILSLAPEQIQWKDTLGLLYFNGGLYAQAKFVAEDILKSKPENQTMMEVLAVSQQSLGMLKESLDTYEKLYARSKNVFHLYKVATLQYSLKRFGECNMTSQKLLVDEKNMEMINITVSEGTTQNVPIKAAVYNMQGVVALEINQKEEAKKLFEEALKITPDFALAKANLDLTNQPKK